MAKRERRTSASHVRLPLRFGLFGGQTIADTIEFNGMSAGDNETNFERMTVVSAYEQVDTPQGPLATALRTFAPHLIIAMGANEIFRTVIPLVQSAIVNGELSDESDDAVVELYAGTGSSRDHCSALLIAPNVIVTALHCVAQFNTLGRFSCSSAGVLTTPTPPDGSIGAPKDPASISVHLGGDRGSDAGCGRRAGVWIWHGQHLSNDIALVVLDPQLDAPIAPVRLERRTRRAELVRTVGYRALVH